MRLRNVPRAGEIIENSPLVVKTPEEYRGRWEEAFSRKAPLHIEIGMGKGRFIVEMARRHPEINYIGIEMQTSVLFRAVEKLQQEEPISNLLFLCITAEKLEGVFAPGEVDQIYLNFSDPWPKDRHHKRRLTSREHLSLYEKFLASEGCVEFKTDNEGLFRFSLEEAPAAGWELTFVSENLHEDPRMGENVMTEYEEKFSSKGQPIYKMCAKKAGQCNPAIS